MQATAKRNVVLGTLTGLALSTASLFLAASPAIASIEGYNGCKNFFRSEYVRTKYGGDWDEYRKNKTLVENSLHNACRSHVKEFTSDKTPAFFYSS